MWEQIKQVLTQRAKSVDTSITVKSQKWLGPGETLRIVDLDCDGDHRRLVLWHTKGGTQMLELSRPSNASLSEGAAC